MPPMTPAGGAGAAACPPLRVLRLCSVFEPPASALDDRGSRFDPIGGMQQHTGSLTRELAARGVAQVVITARPPGAPRVQRLAPGATVVRVSLPVRKPRQLYSVPAAVLAPLLARHADVVHAHLGEDLAILPIAALAARARRLPVVITVHCSLSYTLKGSDARSVVLRTLGGAIERWAARRAATTLVYTSRLAGRLADDAGCRSVRVMRRGVDPVPFADATDGAFPGIPGHPRVVFVGRLVSAKGVETLVQAAGRMRTPGAQVVLVGDGPERARVERTARRLGVDDRVHVTGFIPHDRVPSVFASADLLVLPSHYEELGTVLIEAMHARLPVVASRVGGIPEVVEDGITGLLVTPGEPAALASAIDAVLTDPDLARRLGANAGRRAPDYELGRVATEMHGLYRDLAGQWAARHPDRDRPRRGRDAAAALWRP